MSAQLEADFNRLNISVHDFIDAHASLQEHSEGLNDVLRAALLTAAVVAYARPFSWNRGGEGQASNRVPIVLAEVFTEAQQAQHEIIMGIRNKAAAHSDFDRKPTRRVPVAHGGAMSWSKPYNILGEPIDVGMFREMAWKLHIHCVARTIAINRQLQQVPPSGEPYVPPEGITSLRIPLDHFKPR